MPAFIRPPVTAWMRLPMPDIDVAIIGGGLLGSAFGWGLARAGQRTVVFDEGDTAIRTARGNFGLVWVQGKGQNMPQYAAWTLRASRLWPDFAGELEESTGLGVHYVKEGYAIAADEAELERFIAVQERITAGMGDNAYGYELLDRKTLKSVVPLVSDDVPGAVYTAMMAIVIRSSSCVRCIRTCRTKAPPIVRTRRSEASCRNPAGDSMSQGSPATSWPRRSG